MSKRFLFVLFLAVQLLSTVAQAVETSSSNTANSDRRIPYKGTGESEVGTSAIRVALGLGLVLIAGVGVVLLLRRFLPASYGGSTGPTARRIELVEVRRLTPKLTLFLIEVDDARILLAQSGDRVTPMYQTSLTNRERSDGATTGS